MTEIIDALESFGLSNKESQVYLACLSLGDDTATNISIKSGLPRTLTYDLLERLIDLGLVSYSVKDKKKYFRAADPKELIRIIKDKETKIQDVMGELQKLNSLKGTIRPKVEIYEGREGIKTAANDIIHSDITEMYALSGEKSSIAVMPVFFTKWHHERIKNKIFVKTIYNDSGVAKDRLKNRSFGMMDYRFAPMSIGNPVTTIIYKNRILMISWTEDPFAILIENEHFYNNYKQYFEQLWKIAKKK